MLTHIDSYCWFNSDGKYILIITKGWKGSHDIVCPIDILLIPKSIKIKYKDKFKASAMKNCRVVYTGD